MVQSSSPSAPDPSSGPLKRRQAIFEEDKSIAFYIHFLLTCLSQEPGPLQFLNTRLVKSNPELAAALLNPAPLIDRLLGQPS